MKEADLTLRGIGVKLGKSAERVRQVLNGRSMIKGYSLKIDAPLRTREVALLLNVHVNTVRRWTRSGILKTYRVGPRGDRRFRLSDVQRLVQGST